jgi:drug/metabolite transporter (DMT)-like permease
MIFWGMSFIWTSIALEYYQPITIILLRLILATMIMVPLLAALKKLERIQRKDWGALILLSIFNPFLYFIGENFGLKYTTPTICAVIIALIPVFTPFFTYFFLKEKLSFFNYIGIMVSFIGILIMLIARDLTISTSMKGVLLLFFAVLSAISYSIVLIKLTRRYHPLSLITYQNIIGVFLFLPVFIFYESDGFLRVEFTFELVWALLSLAIFASSLAFILFAMVIKRLGVNRANVYSNLIPVFTAIFSFLIIGEDFTARKIIGMVIVLAGVFLAQVKPNKKPEITYET